MNFLIFPNQLFDTKYLPKKDISHCYLLEDPLYFGHRETMMNFNKLKLILHCASMRHYEKELKDNGFSVKYISYHELKDLTYKGIPKSNLNCFEVNDHLLEKRLQKKLGKLNFHPTPNFCLKTTDLEEFYSKHKSNKTLNHKDFYNFVKSKVGILKGEKSHDMENRNKIPNGTKIPSLPKLKPNDAFLKQSIQYVEKHFPKNYGSTTLVFPVTRKESEKWFHDFLKKKLSNFGKYQDAIVKGEDFLFHSCISPMFNIGLLDPLHIVKESENFFKKHSASVGKNNYEGFMRQVIGWREYQRYCYLYHSKDMQKNVFKNNRKLNQKWYEGTLGIEPVDDAIKMGFEYGYLHHILRLMVMGNFMTLCEISPSEVYRWFMEFPTDSYDWVMIQNVYSMATWSDGGFTMRKPYISSDNYILNMSNYKCGKDEWCPTWKSLYYNFMNNHQDILIKTPYGRNMVHWNKKSAEEKKEELKLAKDFLKKI